MPSLSTKKLKEMFKNPLNYSTPFLRLIDIESTDTFFF